MKIPNIIQREISDLKSKGLKVEIEESKRHICIRINNRLTGIMPRGAKGIEENGRCVLNIRSQMRRTALTAQTQT